MWVLCSTHAQGMWLEHINFLAYLLLLIILLQAQTKFIQSEIRVQQLLEYEYEKNLVINCVSAFIIIILNLVSVSLYASKTFAISELFPHNVTSTQQAKENEVGHVKL